MFTAFRSRWSPVSCGILVWMWSCWHPSRSLPMPDDDLECGESPPHWRIHGLTLADILNKERRIWPEKTPLEKIAVNLAVVTGDVARCARGAKKDADEDIAKELGNLIASAVRWCD